MPARNVDLPEHLNSVIDSEVASGHFADANATVCAGLELLEREQAEYPAKVAWLQEAAQEGIDQLDRGKGIEYASFESFLTDVDRIRDEVLAEASVRSR